MEKFCDWTSQRVRCVFCLFASPVHDSLRFCFLATYLFYPTHNPGIEVFDIMLNGFLLNVFVGAITTLIAHPPAGCPTLSLPYGGVGYVDTPVSLDSKWACVDAKAFNLMIEEETKSLIIVGM
jgi:hypothetical protein